MLGRRSLISSPTLLAGGFFLAAAALARTQLWSHAPQPGSLFGIDFVSYRLGAERLLATGSPYHPALLEGPLIHAAENLPFGYVYPPPLAQVMALVAWVPDPWLMVGWSFVQALALAWLLPLLFRRGGGRLSIATILTIWGVALATYPLQFALYGGNVSGFIAIAICLLLLTGGRPAGAISAGLAVLKLSPAAFFAAAVARSASRWAALGAIVALVGGSFVVSPRAWLEWIRVLPNVLSTPMADACCHYSPAATLQLIGLEPVGIVLGLAITIAAGLSAVWWARSELDWDRAVAAAGISMLFASLTLWEHYAALLVPLAVVVWPRAGRVRRSILLAAFAWQVIAWFVVFMGPEMAPLSARLLTLVALLAGCAAVVPPRAAGVARSPVRAMQPTAARSAG